MVTNVYVIDGESRRRAAINFCLLGSTFHIEPLENAAELIGHWPSAGLLLVHDDPQTITELLAHMTSTGDWLPIICFSENPEPRQVAQAMLAGASNYIAWPFASEEFAEAADVAMAQASSIGGLRIREAKARSKVNRLTRREKEVLAGVACGLPNRLIGERLAISPRTVEIHRANMITKLGLNHTCEAIRIAIESALVA
jgi:two-component system, LuxR family, response regulator FixJ